MATIVIDLQSGFSGQPVTICANGKTVFAKDKVVSKLLLGFAESVVVKDLPDTQPVELTFEVGERAKTKKVVPVGKDVTYLGLNIESDRVVCFVSDHPFGYA